MKLGRWRFGSHKPKVASSRAVPALDRVREMREQANWQPVVSQEVIEHRADLVEAARRQIVIPPLAAPGRSDRRHGDSRTPWLDSLRSLLYGLLALLSVLVAGFHLFNVRDADLTANIKGQTIAFPSAYSRLTEREIDSFARKALLSTGLDWSDWRVEPEPGMSLHRVSDYEGIVVFRHRNDWDAIVEVRVKLVPEDRYVLCVVDQY